MTKKECQKVARKIAKLEKIINSTDDYNEKLKAEEAIIEICSLYPDLDDMIQIDEEVQRIFEKS